ncbi:hypothetical protein HPB48_010448 [Haemaphysalis longicornis]|uniref:Uncharacterized protein n=1 Tax=Haemaphysalis longicornis TaxID=44386 RepID=A0A9J6H501_HAELO|nr:hypothetical protein HPB48_010448 [Haemaphysalis longicornis]
MLRNGTIRWIRQLPHTPSWHTIVQKRLDLCVKSLAVISDCLDHTTAAVAILQPEVLKVRKHEFPAVRKIRYLSEEPS